MDESLFYIAGGALITVALILSFIGMRSDKFPSDKLLVPGIALIALLVAVTAVGAVELAKHEQEHKLGVKLVRRRFPDHGYAVGAAVGVDDDVGVVGRQELVGLARSYWGSDDHRVPAGQGCGESDDEVDRRPAAQQHKSSG